MTREINEDGPRGPSSRPSLSIFLAGHEQDPLKVTSRRNRLSRNWDTVTLGLDEIRRKTRSTKIDGRPTTPPKKLAQLQRASRGAEIPTCGSNSAACFESESCQCYGLAENLGGFCVCVLLPIQGYELRKCGLAKRSIPQRIRKWNHPINLCCFVLFGLKCLLLKLLRFRFAAPAASLRP